jgi:hypothetical protein
MESENEVWLQTLLGVVLIVDADLISDFQLRFQPNQTAGSWNVNENSVAMTIFFAPLTSSRIYNNILRSPQQ